jgi:hypothetical protein
MKLNYMVISTPSPLMADLSVPATTQAQVESASTDAMQESAAVPIADLACICFRINSNGDLLGWRVTVARRGVRVDRQFTVHRYGTSENALQAAMTFRDEVLERVKLLSLTEYCSIVKSHNTSGIPGVRRTKDGAWKMRIKLPDGREIDRYFSVAKHGEQGAFEKAVQARTEALALVKDYQVHHRGKPQLTQDQQSVSVGDHDLARPTYAEVPDTNPYYKERTNIPGVVNFSIPYVRTNGEKIIKHYKMARYGKRGQKIKQRYFSVQEHGEEEALRLAIEQHQAWEREAISDQSGNDQKPRRKRTQNTASVLSAC